MITSIEALLRAEEGLSLKAAKDTVGYVIGYGRNVMTEGISHAEAEFMLANDVAAARSECEHIPFWASLSDVRQGVLLAMHYEMGFHGMLGFRQMLTAMGDGNYAKAAAAILDSDFARHPETAARAHRLAKQMETDAWVAPPWASP